MLRQCAGSSLDNTSSDEVLTVCKVYGGWSMVSYGQ